jgi:hypothetical protein
MKNNKIKSFDQYVENRIIENTDFEKLALLINTRFEENGGYITESDLAEAWFGVPGLARAASGVVGAMGGIGSDIGKAAYRKGQAFGNAIGQAGKAVGNAVGQAGQAVGSAVGQAGQAVGSAVGQAGQAAGRYLGDKYQTATMQQAASQIKDRIVDIQKNPLFTKLNPEQQQNVIDALNTMIS